MSIVVLSRVEQENPFGVLAQTISEEALPYVIALYTNKDKIARLSDTELTDLVEVLQRHAPELVKDGKIDWEKVNDWVSSDEKLKRDVANFLIEAKRVREEFANSPLLVKLQTLDIVGSLNHQELNKIFTVEKSIKKFAEIVEKSDLPTIWKIVLLENAEKFADRPDLIEKLGRVLGVEKEETTQPAKQDTDTVSGGWKMNLEEPQLNLNLPFPPNVAGSQGSKVSTQSKNMTVISSTQKSSSPQSRYSQNTQKPSTSQSQDKQNQINLTPQSNRSSSDEITLPSEVPFLGDVRKLFTNEQLLTAGASALATLLALAATRNPQMSMHVPLLLQSLKETGKNVGKRAVSVVKTIPEKVKEATNILAQSGVVGKVEPPLPKQETITRVINPPKPPSINDLLKKTNTTKQPKSRKSRKSKR
jgi:hypothetical protein